MSKPRHPHAGFSLAELIIVVAVIGLLIAIVIPRFDKANDTSATAQCKAQLQAIEAASEARAMDLGSWTNDANNLVLDGYLRQIPTCKWHGTTYQYTISTVPAATFTFADGSTTLSTKYPAGTVFCPIHGTIKEFREDGVTAAPLPPGESTGGGGGSGME